MAKIVVSVENLTKSYQLGVIDSRTLAKDLNRRWARWRGKPDPYLKIGQEDLSTRRGEMILALDDVSFTVRQGEALGIIGGNGAGKSTLLKILSQVTAPTSGRIRVKGRVGSLLEVGTGFHPELTGRENMYLNGAILGMTRAEVDRKFDEIVDFSGVEQFIDTPVKRYSSGMKVRLGFAVAAHLDPEILIVDEVLAVGDAEFQKKCLGKMGAVAGEGRTVLFVSHNMGAIKALCNRSILLQKGKLFLDDDTEKVVNNYLSQNLSQNKRKPLKERLDRQGTQVGKYYDVCVLYKGMEMHAIPMGSDVTIEATYFLSKEINRARFGFFFKDKNGQVILRAYSRESSTFRKAPAGIGRVSCTFRNLPLMFGEYQISLYLGIPNEPIDYIDNVTMVKIEPADVYGTGVLPGLRNSGYCYTEHSWNFINEK